MQFINSHNLEDTSKIGANYSCISSHDNSQNKGLKQTESSNYKILKENFKSNCLGIEPTSSAFL